MFLAEPPLDAAVSASTASEADRTRPAAEAVPSLAAAVLRGSAAELGERELQSSLLAWFQRFGRDLPWRRTRDPYAILVSEIMLQQTQVSRVIDRYVSWLERWPTVGSLAHASSADVVRAWSGLGYNRRALNLQRAARAIVERGGFPDTVAGLLELPGVGPYTARAIACFAFGAEVTALDVNVTRVLERAFGRADVEPPTGLAWEWNQALFDLGAELCRARVPRCLSCPLQGGCPSAGRRFEPARRQGPFEGSRRQLRARLVRELHAGPRAVEGYAAEVVDGLLRDGLALRLPDGRLALPEESRA